MLTISSTAIRDALGPVKSRLPSRRAVKRTAFALALLTGTAVASQYGYRYWTVGQYLESTDNAYVQADSTIIAPRVSGYLSQVLVRDNERVEAGRVLARIDDRDFRTALDQARADVEAAEAAIRNLDAEIVLQQSNVAQQNATIAEAEASLAFAQQDQARYRDLMRTGYGTVQRAQQTDAAMRERTAQLQRSRAGAVAAQQRISVLGTQRGVAEAQRDRSRALARQAELNLSYTVVSAPVTGTVGARTLRVGQYVQAGTQLMAIVPVHAVYVVANFKETQLTNMRDGQPVSIEVDAFPGVVLTGHVDSLSPASGLQFALLPPDNATGNFTKIVQRIPVRIVIDDARLGGLLRAGMSVEATVDTRRQAEAQAERGTPSAAATPGSSGQGAEGG
jgi:membrane fusion protein (multidrug efflux system)